MMSTTTLSEKNYTSQPDKRLRWQQVSADFVNAVPAVQRDKVMQLLHHPNGGGSGLRQWVYSIAFRGGVLPPTIPHEVIEIYLRDSEATPLYDCESCGLALPVRPSRLYGLDSDPEEVYFVKCPSCGGRTGFYCHFTHRYEQDFVSALRRRPR
jgi:hypothetical protein